MTKRIWTSEEEELVKQLREQGYSHYYIATKVGRSETSVRKRCKTKGWLIKGKNVNTSKYVIEDYVEQLCWNCTNSGGLCRWSAYGEPVPGWEAEEVKPKAGSRVHGPWYKVSSCPEFKKG